MKKLAPLLTCLFGINLAVGSLLHSAPFDDLEIDVPPSLDEKVEEPATEPPVDGDPLQDTELSSSAKAMIAYRRGEIEICLSHLKDAVASKPSLPPPDLVLAGFHLKARQYGHARALLEEFAAGGSRHPQLYLSLAKLALVEGRLADAASHLEIAETLGPPVSWNENEKQWFQSAIIEQRTAIAEHRGNWREAALLMEKWLQFEPDVLLRRRYATALFAQGKVNQAFEQFDIAHRSDSRVSPPEVAMGALSLRQGDIDGANDWYNKAIAAHPENAAAHLEWAIALLYQDRAAEAREQVRHAEKLGLASVALHVNRGMIARQLGDLEEAVGHFERALKVQPGHREAKRQLALALADHEDVDQRRRAVELAETLLLNRDATARDLATAAWIHHQVGEEPKARQALEKALAANPQDAETLFLSARLLLLLGDHEQGDRVAAHLRERIDDVSLFVSRPQARKWLDTLDR